MNVALVHDYLKEYGGGERVLEALHKIFPNAPIYTAYFNPNSLGPHSNRIKKWNIKTSWFQNFPLSEKLISPFRVFAPLMFESFDLKDYDLVISSCNTYFSKAVITKPGSLHLSYIHTPPRYLYGYTTSFNYKKHWWTRVMGELMNHFLRIYDYETSQRPDILIANSKNIKERIKKFYRRDSIVIYPPINLENFKLKKQKGDYFLALNRLVRGKGTEVIVEAATKLNLPLKVVGTGPELSRLRKLAGKNVQFLGEVKDEDLPQIYSKAKALIVSSEDEDFGITAIESQASGTPVIAVKAGGYLETVIERKTGEFFASAKVEDQIKALESFNEEKYKVEDLRKNAERFSQETFKKQILETIAKNQKSSYT